MSANIVRDDDFERRMIHLVLLFWNLSLSRAQFSLISVQMSSLSRFYALKLMENGVCLAMFPFNFRVKSSLSRFLALKIIGN